MRTLALVLVTLGLGATASANSPIQTGDVAGSNGTWQEGRAIVDAPVDEVRHWFTDYDNWKAYFPDIKSSQVLARGNDWARVRFRSRIIGRDLTIDAHWTPREVTYSGFGKSVNVQGKIEMQPLGARRTQVVLQTTADVHGMVGALASPEMRRNRAIKKLRADLTAIQRLSQTM